MRAVVWNMAHRQRGWAALAKLGADVALLNEARVPSAGIEANAIGGQRTEGRDGYRRNWAAAIVSPHELRRIEDATASRYGRPLNLPFVNSRPGSWEAATVVLPGAEEVTVISLYGLMDEKSDASVHGHCLSWRRCSRTPATSGCCCSAAT